MFFEIDDKWRNYEEGYNENFIISRLLPTRKVCRAGSNTKLKYQCDEWKGIGTLEEYFDEVSAETIGAFVAPAKCTIWPTAYSGAASWVINSETLQMVAETAEA